MSRPIYFDKETLIKKGVFSHNGKIGKMAIRIYPPWAKPTSNQAIKTQQWQLHYFFSFDSVDHKKKICALFHL